MFVLYGPIGDGPKWRATRGEASQDFDDSADALAGALRMAAGNKGKLRRTRYSAPAAPAPKPAAPKPAPAPALPWDGMNAKTIIKALKAGDFDALLDDIEAGETRKSVLAIISERR